REAERHIACTPGLRQCRRDRATEQRLLAGGRPPGAAGRRLRRCPPPSLASRAATGSVARGERLHVRAPSKRRVERCAKERDQPIAPVRGAPSGNVAGPRMAGGAIFVAAVYALAP